MSNYMLGCRLIDCFLTLLMLDLMAASRHEALRSFNKQLPDPGMPSLPGRDEVKTKVLVDCLSFKAVCKKKKKPGACKLDVSTVAFDKLAHQSKEVLEGGVFYTRGLILIVTCAMLGQIYTHFLDWL